MTARQVFEYALIELNKVQAPSLLLEDYNYFINKAINQYVNKVYNMYDVNQQKSDDVRVLKSSAILKPKTKAETTAYKTAAEAAGFTGVNVESSLFGSTKEVDLPDDYLHILNCVVEYSVTKNFKCYDASSRVHFGATRLTSDMFSQIINNYYMRPSYKQPYFYVNNVTTNNNYATKDSQKDIPFGYTPQELSMENGKYVKDAEGRFVLLDGTPVENSSIEKVAENRFGNRSKVRMEIRYGKDDKLFVLERVYIDYLKAPQFIRLTQDQVDQVQDTSQLLEFQDYVCQEIVNELVTLLMENASDPRLQSQIPINQSIASPQQEGGEQQQRRRR